MTKTITQIYEIQSSEEAEIVINAGVDTAGSVILSEENWKLPAIGTLQRNLLTNHKYRLFLQAA